MKKTIRTMLLIAALAAALVFALPVMAEGEPSGPCGDSLFWMYKDGTLEITGSGAMADFSYDGQPWNSCRENIVSVSLPEGLTHIGNEAFYACRNLTSVTLPSTVESIGSSAFQSCSSLVSVSFPAGLAFIGDSAFEFCLELSSVTLPDSLEYLGAGAFRYCSGLSSAVVPGGISGISNYVFYYCLSLNSVTAGEGLRYIANGAFESCGDLQSLALPSTLTAIGATAFKNAGLTSVSVPEGVESIGAEAFRGCSGLASVSFAGPAPAVGDSAFAGVTADAFYPAHEPTWTHDTLISYGGTLLWQKRHMGLLRHFAAVAPGCETDGSIEYWDCAVCLQRFKDAKGLTEISEEDTVDPALGHDVIVHEYQAPTCTEDGWYPYEACTRCDYSTYTEQTRIPALGHDVIVHEYQAPTCTENGRHEFETCTRCTYSTFTEQTVIPALGHDIEFHPYKAATCTEAGLLEFDTCTRCDYSTYTEQKVIPARGHLMTHYAESLHCELYGNPEYYHCYNCNKNYADKAGTTELTSSIRIAPLGHDLDENGVCRRCKRKQAGYCGPEGTDNLRWELKNNTLTITGTGRMEDYSIFDGDYPTAPWYYSRSYIHKLSLSDGMTDIGMSAFESCNSLKEASIPESIKTIGSFAFSGTGLTSVRLPAGLTCIGEHVFSCCPNLTDVTITPGVTKIGVEAFYACRNLKNVVIPDSVTSIGYGVFWSCSSLTSVRLPAGLTSIDSGTFKDCSSLKNITLPAGVSDIDISAFSGSGLTSITLPAGVTRISYSAFQGCSDLSEITFTGSAPAIQASAFSGVTGDVYYPLHATGWNESTMLQYGGNLTYHASHMGLVHHEGVAAACETDGSIEYWECPVCARLYTDAEGLNEITAKDIVIPATGHQPEYFPVAAPSCTENGSNGYWRCAFCGRYFAEEACMTELTEEEAVLPAFGHTLEHFEEVPNGHLKSGMREYWHCTVCEKLYLDEACTAETCEEELFLPALEGYAIRYELNGGRNNAANPGEYNPATDGELTLAKATRTGYTFKGWYLDAAFTKPAPALDADLHQDITVYAKWAAKTYSVTYVLNGGKNHADNLDTYTTDGRALYKATRTAYTFTGWYKDAALIEKWAEIPQGTTGALTLYAGWTPVNYKVIYELNGGTNNEGNPATYTKEDAAFTLKKPVKTGYTFNGWYKEETFKTKVTTIAGGATGKVTLYAKWTAKSYAVTYVLNGGTNNEGNPATYTTGNVVTLKNATKKGYSFKGWHLEPELETKVTEIAAGTTGALTLYAKFAIVNYNVVYELNGGTQNAGNIATYTVNDPLFTLKKPTRTGYTFNGWYKESTFKTEVTSIAGGTTGKVTLYAKWTPKKYAITYELNGGTNNAANPATYTIEGLALKNASKKGYSFKGWYLEPAFETKVTEIAAGTTGAVTLYAKFAVVNYNVVYELNGGTQNAGNPATYTVNDTLITLKKPTKTGYTFNGWYKESTFATKVTEIAGGTTGKVTLYAKWTPKKYAITYELNGGKNNAANPATYTIEGLALKNASKKGYSFKGWYLDEALTEKVTEIPAGTTGALTLYAKFAIVNYKVVYELNGGKQNAGNPATYTVNDAAFTLKKPTKAGFTFSGWYKESTFKTKVTEIVGGTTGKVTLYAKWTAKSYTITYELNGGRQNTGNPASYKITTALFTLLKPTRTGYTFKGWFLEPEFKTKVTEIGGGATGKLTLYAKWAKKA